MAQKVEVTGPCVGIDLGTTNSAVSIYRNGRAETIPNDQGSYTTPSVVSFDENGERLVGEAAVSQRASYPESTLYTVKRLIGRTIDDPAIQDDLRHWTFKVVSEDVGTGEHAQQKCRILVPVSEDEQRSFAPEEVSAMVLEKMRKVASDFLGKDVRRAVITVPAHFNDAQRQATMLAGRIAGLHVERIINEPTAAAMAYGLDKIETHNDKFRNILVFDFGGGTLDVTIMRCKGGVFRVLGTGGDTHLGGEDLDIRISDYVISEWRRISKIPDTVEITGKMRTRLRSECERAKRTLSQALKTTVMVESFFNDKTLRVEITRARFEELARELFDNCMHEVDKTLAQVQKDNKDFTVESIENVVLVGGSSRIPRIRTLLEERFGQRNGKSPLCLSVNPDEVVAQGAAIQAASLTSQDEITSNILLVDVAPLSLGVEVHGENGPLMDVVIARNSTIPVVKKKEYGTTVDNQPSVSIIIIEGERKEAKYCRRLGYFELRGLRPLPRGQARVSVSFKIDENGILTVEAEDTTTGVAKKMTIDRNAGQLKPDQVERMIADAERNREHDAMVEKRSMAINKLEGYLTSVKVHWDQLELETSVREEGCARLLGTERWLMPENEANGSRCFRELEAIEARFNELTAWFSPHLQRAPRKQKEVAKN